VAIHYVLSVQGVPLGVAKMRSESSYELAPSSSSLTSVLLSVSPSI
jgi:hypothetical protein